MKPTKVSVVIKKTVQEVQYEPVTIELGIETEVLSENPKLIREAHIKMSNDLQDTLDDIFIKRLKEKRGDY